MSEQNLKTFEKALKEIYLPAWKNQLSIEPSPLLGKIKTISLKGNDIVASAPVGLSGGFGFGEEGERTPAAGHVRFERFKTTAKDMYVNICISQKAVSLGTNSGAMADSLTTEIKGAYDAAKWNVGRALYGNGTGVLTTISALEAAGNTISVADTKYLKEGLIIDIYEDGGEVPVITGRRILAIDRIGNTITISGTATTVADGFITVQNSYNREITGLGAIFDNNIDTLYGVSKTSNPFLKPIAHDAGGEIDDGTITKILRDAQNHKNSKVDMLLCGNDAYDTYVNYLRSSNVRVDDISHSMNGGFKAIKFVFGNREVDIVNEEFVPNTEMWGVDTTSLELHNKDWNFAELQGGGVFNLMENQSVYRALLVNYGDLICTNPGGCVRLYNCA